MSDHIDTLEDMRRAGYKFLGHAKCKGCGADIEWWLTNNGKKLSFDPMPESDIDRTTPHWASCKKADDFRPEKTPSTTSSNASLTFNTVQPELDRLRRRSNARVIVAIFDDGSAAAWRKGIPGEDLRHELITEANSIRNHIDKGATR